MSEIKRVAVIGAGEMGHGIAEVISLSGCEVNLVDIKEEILYKAIERIKESLERLLKKGNITNQQYDETIKRIKTFLNLEEALKDVQLVIEAVPENLQLKRNIFKKIDEVTGRDVILATNTSNIRITQIAEGLKYPERVVGMHFFNPPVVMKLVEIIKGEYTSDEVLNIAYEFAKKLGKVPVKVKKDTPGFIVNRITAPESLYFCFIIQYGIAKPEEVDAFIKMQGLPMGPYELMDYVGLDIVYESLKYYSTELSPEYGKCKVYAELVESGKLGKKSGKGFYDWSSGRPSFTNVKPTDKVYLLDILSLEINEAVKLIEEGVATPEDIETAVKLGLNRPFGPITVAKNLTNQEVKQKLLELYNKFNCSVFYPAKSIEEGKMREAIEGRLSYQETKVQKEATKEAIYKEILLDFPADKIARITINRPKLNTISSNVLEELDRALDFLWNNQDIRIIIITGQGNNFSAGADLSTYIANSFQFLEFSRKGQRVFRKISEIPKITIAALKGYVLGGGFELALACDLRIATEDCVLGFPELTLGLLPAWGGSQRLAKLLGISRALDMILTARRITGKEAYQYGLISKLVQNIDEEALNFAKELADKIAPVAAALVKRLINKASEVPSDVGLEMESFSAGVIFGTEDLKEGISAFLQKRKPEFKGK
ncbi:MAG: 3-hydroxyacyl-CoA dehydrogenase NAD-binding domain-containing protein [Thermoproteota archaeon]